MNAITPLIPGFGDYSFPEGKSLAQIQTCAKVQKIFFAVIFGLFTALSFFLIPASLPLAVIGIATFSYQTVKALLNAVGLFYRAKPMQQLFPKTTLEALPPLNLTCQKPCSGFATRDATESQQWKLNLIREAKYAILFSGCYCGGKSFDETLDLIQERMRQLPQLTTSILSSDMFITAENKKRIAAMTQEFGPRFTCVVTPEVFPFVSPTTDRLSLSTNHTKALIIDYGAAFMMGGSGMVSSWSEQKGETAPEQVEPHGLFYDHVMKTKAYRDMDFVFQAPELNGTGTLLHTEMTKLHERFRYRKEPPAPITSWPIRVEPLAMPNALPDLKLALYASGPEQPSTAFLDAVIEEIQKAKESVYIGHMYFHPTPKLQKALLDATNRGIQVTIETNKLGNQSPGSHLAFTELSRYYAKSLFEGKAKPNLHLHEYDVPYTTYHKKVIVIDRKTTFGGSSNIGQKSLDASDYEINFKVESPDFAQSVIQNLEEDQRFCKSDSEPHISLKTRLLSSVQSHLTPFL